MDKILCFLICGVIITGCAVSDNPNEGGLFGYWLHKDDYQKRLDERRQRLDQLEQEIAKEQQKSSELENKRATMQTALDRQRTLLYELSLEVDRLKETLQQYQVQTVEKQQEKHRIEMQIEQLKQQVYMEQKSVQAPIQEQADIDKRQEEIRRLRDQLESLLLLASEL